MQVRTLARVVLLGLLALHIAVGLASPARAAGLRLASDVWPPFTDEPLEKRVAIELVQTALARRGIEANSEIREDFGGLVDEIRAGGLDGSAALWRSDEREQFLLFSRPYLQNRLVLLGRKGSDVSATSLSSLPGKRIGIVERYAYGEEVTGAEGPELVGGPSDQENLERLIRGDLDYLLADELLIHELFERSGGRAESLLVAGRFPIVERSLHFAIRRALPGAESIVKGFDESIREMMADGSYNRILGVVWIETDVDGDGASELVLGGEQAGRLPPRAAYKIFRPDVPGIPTRADTGYVVYGNRYESWQEVPPDYRVPIERPEQEPRPGVVRFAF
jgi:ABC-type amino acid transport substrate-binding protein